MATVVIQPGAADGYQITQLPDGSLLITQVESMASGDVLEWDDEFAAVASGSGKLLGMATAKIQGIAAANIL